MCVCVFELVVCLEEKEGGRAGGRMSVVARLSALELERARSRAERREAGRSARDERESSAVVAATVDKERGKVRELLASARATATALKLKGKNDDDVGGGELVEQDEEEKESRRRLEMIVNEAARRVADMDSTLSSCSYFLPAYDAKSLQAVIAATKREVAAAKAELVPRKKFRFRYFEAPISMPDTLEIASETLSRDDEYMADDGRNADTIDCAGNGVEESALASSSGVRDREDEVIVVDRTDIGGGEFTISDLRRCTVHLIGPTAGLYLHKLIDCTVHAGPTSGAVHVEEASSCSFSLASHQLRVHSASSCDLMLRVRSSPIIEHTSGVRVAPYAYRYDGIDADLEAARLDERELREGGRAENWSRVEDFGWVRVTKSPNWDVMPADARPAPVVAPGSEEADVKTIEADTPTTGAAAAGNADVQSNVGISSVGAEDESDDEL